MYDKPQQFISIISINIKIKNITKQQLTISKLLLIISFVGRRTTKEHIIEYINMTKNIWYGEKISIIINVWE